LRQWAIAHIGYARVSTTEQHLHLQQDALSAAGCLKIFTDTISGAKSERKGLSEALDYIREGDTLVVWRYNQNVIRFCIRTVGAERFLHQMSF
jgi:DNA invertase Pin-like site-specific DNA recombinase